MSPKGKESGKRSAKVEIQVQASPAEVARAAALEFLEGARRAVKERGLFSVALSGGSTPKSLYSLLANDPSFRGTLPWDKIHFFFGDERHVPPDHPDSNYRMADKSLLSRAPLPSENIHRIRAENPDARQVAEEYEEMLQTFFRLKGGEFPRFDLTLLGMGPDGHTASLFPGTEALSERNHLVVANWVEKFQTHRITMTLPVFNQGAFVMFLVIGEEKSETLRQVLEGEEGRDPLPAQLILPKRGRLLWLVDRAAGRLLEEKNNHRAHSAAEPQPNPKHEIPNSKQIRMTKIQTSKQEKKIPPPNSPPSRGKV